jgi:tetratricopeptide (TPR) repeat protein
LNIIQPAFSDLIKCNHLKIYGYIQSLLLFPFLLLPSLSHAQSPTPTVIDYNPAAYRFQTETVWAKLSVTVIDFKSHFQIECQSDHPTEGWVLANRQNDKNIANSDEDSNNGFKINVTQPFTDYLLTVFVQGNDDEQIPMIIDLEPDKDKVTKLSVYTPFVENPDRAYNTLVKSLYEQAGQAYGRGDIKSAIDLLEKAQQVDPTEPQVLAFAAQLKPQADDNSTQKFIADAIAKAQKAEVDKNIRDAEKWYAEVLEVDPKNKTAVESIDRLQTVLLEQAAQLIEKDIKDGDYPKAKTLLVKIKQDYPNDVRIKQWEDQIDQLSQGGTVSDRQAKADEAYNLGLDSYRKDDYVSAKKFWEQTLQIDPQYIQAQQNLDRLNQEHPVSQ